MTSTISGMDLTIVLTSTITALVIGLVLGIFIKKQIVLKHQEAEYKKAIDLEKKAKEAAEDAIRARDEFLSIATHELKTPLTTITLRLQSTLDSILNQSLANFSGEKLVSSLSIAQEQTRRLQNLIKDLLNFSLITTGKLNLELKTADLTDIVKSTIDRFEDHLNLAGCKIDYQSNGPIDGLWDRFASSKPSPTY